MLFSEIKRESMSDDTGESLVASEGRGVLKWFSSESQVTREKNVEIISKYLKGGFVVLLGKVIPEGSLSDLFGCKGAANHLLSKEPGLTTGHHLTRLQRCI